MNITKWALWNPQASLTYKTHVWGCRHLTSSWFTRCSTVPFNFTFFSLYFSSACSKMQVQTPFPFRRCCHMWIMTKYHILTYTWVRSKGSTVIHFRHCKIWNFKSLKLPKYIMQSAPNAMGLRRGEHELLEQTKCYFLWKYVSLLLPK